MVDEITLQWRENFQRQYEADRKYQSEILAEIRDLVKAQNGRLRANELAIQSATQALAAASATASETRSVLAEVVKQVNTNTLAIGALKTWVTLVGGLGGILGGLGVVLAVLVK